MAIQGYWAPLLLAVMVVCAVTIFVVDSRLPLGVSAGFPYVVVVLLAVWLPWRRSPLVAAALSSVLIVAGLRSPPAGGLPWMVLGSRALSLFVIWVTAFLGARYKETANQLGQRVREHTRELSEANAALLQREAYLRQVIEATNAVILGMDLRGRVIEWNQEAELVYGVSKEEVMALDNYERLLVPETVDASRAEFRRLMAGGEPNRAFENRILRPDGEERVLSWSGVALRQPDGAVFGVLGSGVDITDFRRMDREREERLRFEELIADLSARLSDPTIKDSDETILDGLRGLGELMGVDRAGIGFFEEESGRLIGAHLWKAPEFEGDKDPIPDRQQVLDQSPWLVEKLRRGEDLLITPSGGLPEEADFERRFRDRVGGASAAFVPMLVGGKAIGCLSLALVQGRDRAWPEIILKRLRLVASIIGGEMVRRRTEERLRLATAETRAILDTAVDGIVTVLPDGTVETFSPSAEQIFGYSADEIVGENIAMLWTAEERERFEAEHGGAMPTPKVTLGPRGEVLRRHKDGTRIPMHLSIGEINVGGKRLYTGFLRDLREEKAMEQRLRAAASEAALAEQRERKVLASDLHDGLGQLLSLASMKLGALRSKIETSEIRSLAREVEEVIGEADRRTTSLTYQLSPPVLDDVGLVAAAEWLAEDLQRRYGVRVSLSHDARVGSLDEAGRVTLFRALRELLINVAKHAGAEEARVHIGAGDGFVRVSVSDRGCGFDPGEESDGFGLLSLRDRIQHLGGKLEIESALGRGTLVTASVPELGLVRVAPSAPH